MTPTNAALVVLGGSIVFIVGAIGLGKAFFRALLAKHLAGDSLEIATVLATKLTSGVLFGGAAWVSLRATLPEATAVAVSLTWTWRAAAVLAVVAAISLTLVARTSRAPAMRERYPEARVARWTHSAQSLDALGWIVYLYGYELLFRGALLLPLAACLPLVAALAIHTTVYALAHLDKPLAEILGTLPMGFVFGWLAVETHSILPGTALHVAIALTNSTLCARGDHAAATASRESM